MSQIVDAHVEGKTPEEEQQDEFLLGFQDGEQEGARAADADSPEKGSKDQTGQEAATEPTEQTRAQGEPEQRQTQTPQSAPHSPEEQPLEQDTAPRQVPQQAEEREPAKIPIADDIRDEWEELRKISPEAAAMAEEDSEAGQAVRKRLGSYGAESAMDRADIIIERRKQAFAAQQAEQRAVAEHNAHFQAVLQREVPDVFAMTQDPACIQEAAQFMQNMKVWIEGKPYTEAAQLMETYRKGRDPHKVAAMIKQYQQENAAPPQATRSVAASAEDMIAVPGRRAPVAPSGVGDKDDFYAGLSMNR